MLYIEVTHMLEFARDGATLTGIQRLTFNAACELTELLGNDNVRLLAYDFNAKEFRSQVPDVLKEFWAIDATDMRGKASGVSRSTGDALFAPFLNSRLMPDHKAWQYPLFSRNDAVLLTESWWWRPEIIAANESLKNSQVRVFRFVHDLIPLITTEFVDFNFSNSFQEGFERSIKACDVVIANSHATKRDIENYMKLSADVSAPVRVVPLAHEFQIQPRRYGAALYVGDSLKQLLYTQPKVRSVAKKMSAQPHVLCVGTLEGRKNLFRLTLIWQKLLKKHGRKLPRLVLVGKWGFPSRDLQHLLRRTNNLDRHVEVLRNVDDHGLEMLYRGCAFSMYISHYEGWGLPVGESMWFGKPVICSNTSSMPEVGMDLVDYVHPEDDSSIEQAIERLSFDKNHYEQMKNRLAEARLRTWKNFAEELAAVMSLNPKKPIRRRLTARQLRKLPLRRKPKRLSRRAAY